MYVTRPRRVFWFPSLRASRLPLSFRLVWTEAHTSPSFRPYSTAWLLRKGSGGVLAEQGPQHTPSTALGGCLQEQGSGCMRTHWRGKQPWKKMDPLSPKTRRTNSLITFEDADSALHANFVLLHFIYCFSSNSWCLFFLLLLRICTLILQPGHFPLISQLLSAVGFTRYHREFKTFSIKILHGCSC